MKQEIVEILLVEDNVSDEKLVKRAFNKANIISRLKVVRDGAEALDFIFGSGVYKGRNINQLPKFVMLDLKLPKVNGLEVLKKIRENKTTAMLPVVMFTSSQEVSDILNCYQSGANSYIVKPIDFGDFVAAVTGIGSYWTSLNKTVLN